MIASMKTSPEVQKRNFRNVQIDAIGIGLSAAVAPFLPVFLTRLGASNFQVGLLSSMPAVTGLILSLVVGRFLQTRRNVVPWFSLARLMVISCYALTGLVPLFIHDVNQAVNAVLFIWAYATLPQTMVAVAFTVVMNAVAGPDGRYALLSRRWSTLGLTNFVATWVVSQFLVRVDFPVNYQVAFLALSVGGLISFYFSSRITLPDQEPPPLSGGSTLKQNISNYFALLRQAPGFQSFVTKRLVYLSGVSLAVPLFPLYFVREVGATDAWIGNINMTFTFVLLIGYFLWPRVSRRRGGRFVLLVTTLGVMFYPALTAMTHAPWLIAIYAGTAGFFQAGLDLVFFDELMKTVPPEYSATFVALAQSLQYLSAIAAPLVGTFLADHIGLSGALLISAGLRLAGFMLFALKESHPVPG